MKVILFGASGMVGQGVLRECLLDADVTEVVAVARGPLGRSDPKLRQVFHDDFTDFTAVAGELSGADACFYCLGVSTAGHSPADYTRITYDCTLAAARTVAAGNPGLTFTYVSGEGTDSTEQGRTGWARVKGRTENALLAMDMRAYMFRPGFIQPMYGAVSKVRLYRVMYTLLRPLTAGLVRFAPGIATTTQQLGLAMLRVAREGGPKRVLESRDIAAL